MLISELPSFATTTQQKDSTSKLYGNHLFTYNYKTAFKNDFFPKAAQQKLDCLKEL